MSEAKIYSELIWRLIKKERFDLIDKFLINLKNKGKSYLLKDILGFLKDKINEENNIVKGNLKLAFEDDIEFVIQKLTRKLAKKIEIKKIEIDENLILGGIFVSRYFKFDFSLKNLINKVFSSL